MGPGPVNAHPRVLRAMSADLLGQFDPEMTGYMNEVMALYRPIFGTENRWTFLIDGTARAGIEAALVIAGRAGRHSAGRQLRPLRPAADARSSSGSARSVETVVAPWGEVVPMDAIAAAIERTAPKVVACRPRRHLDHHGAAARGPGRAVPSGWRAVLCRCDRDDRRHGDRRRTLGRRRRHRRAAEVPGRPVGLCADHHLATAPPSISRRAAMSRRASARARHRRRRGARGSAPTISISRW